MKRYHYYAFEWRDGSPPTPWRVWRFVSSWIRDAWVSHSRESVMGEPLRRMIFASDRVVREARQGGYWYTPQDVAWNGECSDVR